MFHPHRCIHTYVHQHRIGALVEFGLSTDFAARTDEFAEFAREVSLQVAAMAPVDVAALLAQPSIKRADATIGELLAVLSAQLGEPVAVTRFVRWSVEDAPVRQEEPDPSHPTASAATLRAAS
ncbi:hypothetical protein [Lysobacter enzymogenes]|uniref:Elongation factor Ts n=1 Tax=Lysobacter enzymogenes TaxID=69 RepID=A0AAU9AW44_LYSEN|nr:hypothetical protein [Lysobacter enzymogenes]BAV98472.1 elongation factor Ts [Lysobacter enzymogenes]